jgi:hypothetical protein
MMMMMMMMMILIFTDVRVRDQKILDTTASGTKNSLAAFYEMRNSACTCEDIKGLIQELTFQQNLGDWRIFIVKINPWRYRL